MTVPGWCRNILPETTFPATNLEAEIFPSTLGTASSEKKQTVEIEQRVSKISLKLT